MRMVYAVNQDGDAIYNLGMAEQIQVINGCVMVSYSGKSHVVARYSDDKAAERAFKGMIEALVDADSLPFTNSTCVYEFAKE